MASPDDLRPVDPVASPGDLKSPLLIHLKGWLFLAIAVLSGAMLICLTMDWRVAALLGMTVWAACRFYFYAFYVIERWVDGRYRFAGLGSFIAYLIRRRR
jgi:hypothetical protein